LDRFPSLANKSVVGRRIAYIMPSTDPYLGYYPDTEIVFGIVSPIGVDYRPVVTSLKNYLAQFDYSPQEIRISDNFEDIASRLTITSDHPMNGSPKDLMWRKIQLGDRICEKTRHDEVLALIAVAAIEKERPIGANPKDPPPNPKTAHIVISLKRPQEVATLRRVYGAGFFLIGIAANENDRDEYFRERGLDEEEQTRLVEIDAAEKNDSGQHTRDTFYLSDVFVSLEDHSTQIERFLDLVFGCPFKTPTFEERSMYLAYAASLSSGDLARQVGAALMDRLGDCLGVGWNDVPKHGGGVYGPEPDSHRDMDQKVDSNDAEKLEMAVRIIRALKSDILPEIALANAKELLAGTGFFDITEFGRAVHAEMAAILACSRTNRTPVGGTLFVTTFPCHNCTRHIIAAGLDRVYYIEPYAKSKALKLHGDACTESKEEEGKVPFLPFIGVGPRRFLDLFSLSLGTGYPIERKHDGKMADWKRRTAAPRLQMAPVSYLIRERLASTTLKDLLLSTQQELIQGGAQNESSGTDTMGANQSSG
jgi:deoxycytidylate deaminase